MRLRDSRTTSEVRTRRVSTWVVFVLCISTIFSPISYADELADGANCAELTAAYSDPNAIVTDPELVDDSSAVLAEVAKSCPTQTSCSDEHLEKALTDAIQKKGGKSREALRKILRIPRRAIVLLLWGTSILGPGLLSYYLGSKLGLQDGMKITMRSFIMTITGILFGRFSSPVDKRLSPKVEKLAYVIWDPGDNDGWGQIQRSINEADRLRNGQIYNQLMFLRAYIKEAGYSVKRGDYESAGRHYSNAILNSCDMFAGLHLSVSATIREVRTYLPEVQDIPDDAKREIIKESIARINKLKLEEIPKDWTKPKLVRFAVTTLMTWLHLESQK